MNAIASIVTATSVLVHAVLGCCSHHAHGGQVACPASKVTTESPEQGHYHCCKHQYQSQPHEAVADQDGSIPAPVPHKSCDESRCAAVLVNKLIDSQVTLSATVPLAVSCEIAKTSVSRTVSSDYASLQHDLGPPLRAHLCHCVLLV
jgi:hypothetical protein